MKTTDQQTAYEDYPLDALFTLAEEGDQDAFRSWLHGAITETIAMQDTGTRGIWPPINDLYTIPSNAFDGLHVLGETTAPDRLEPTFTSYLGVIKEAFDSSPRKALLAKLLIPNVQAFASGHPALTRFDADVKRLVDKMYLEGIESPDSRTEGVRLTRTWPYRTLLMEVVNEAYCTDRNRAERVALLLARWRDMDLLSDDDMKNINAWRMAANSPAFKDAQRDHNRATSGQSTATATLRKLTATG